MHFHDNPTDTQHHSAHTCEVSFGSTTPQRNPSDTARCTFGSQAAFPPSTVSLETGPLENRRRVAIERAPELDGFEAILTDGSSVYVDDSG